jgi:hypothetical protein
MFSFINCATLYSFTVNISISIFLSIFILIVERKFILVTGLVNNNGVLEIEEEDLIKLDLSLKSKKNKRGKPYDEFFRV